MRGLHYFSRLYSKLVDMNDLDIYGSKRLSIPTPRYIVFYFGTDPRPERETLSLSDSFEAGPGDLEVTATVFNCNEGHNQGIMSACEALRGYAQLIAIARGARERGVELDEAVRGAVDRCIEEGILADYLSAHRAEVEEMLFTMQDEERAMRVHLEALKREAVEEGREEGLAQGREEGLAEGIQQGREEGLLQGIDTLAKRLAEQGLDEATIMSVVNELRAEAPSSDSLA